MSPWISDLYLRSQTDARLLSLTRDGHGRAFAILAERYRAELLAQARRLSDTGNAEDLLQQTLLSAFAALNRGAEIGHARGWLHTILRHAASRARAPVEAPLEHAPQVGEVQDALLEARADAWLVLTALDELPDRQREALVGSAIQGLSRAELATTLGVSEGAVRQLVHRARSAVRVAITSLTPYPVLRWLIGAGGPAPGGPPEAMIATGAAGMGGVVAKLGAVAAAGAIAASGFAVAGHHGSPRSAHAGRPAPVGRRSARVANVARIGTDPRVSAASAADFVTASLGATNRGGARPRMMHRAGTPAAPWDGSGLGQVRGADRSHRSGSSSGDGGAGGSRSASGTSTFGREGGSDGGSRSVSSSSDGGGGSDGGSGSGSSGSTTTAAPSASTPAATTASDGGGSGGGGSNDGGGSGQVTPASATGADGGQTAATSTTSTGSRDLLPPAGSSLPTDH